MASGDALGEPAPANVATPSTSDDVAGEDMLADGSPPLLLAVPTFVIVLLASAISRTVTAVMLPSLSNVIVIAEGDEGARALQMVCREDGLEPLAAVPSTSSVQDRPAPLSLKLNAAGAVPDPIRAEPMTMSSRLAVGVKLGVVTAAPPDACVVAGEVSATGALIAMGYSIAANTRSIWAMMALRTPTVGVLTIASSSKFALPRSKAG